MRNLCTTDGKSDSKSISWRRRSAKKRRTSELGGGVYGHLRLDFDLACGHLSAM